MEIALTDAIPTYSGGLGVLAGDFLMSRAGSRPADGRGHPLLPRRLLRQRLDDDGHQDELPVEWQPDRAARAARGARSQVEVGGRTVAVGALAATASSASAVTELPVILLDTKLAENDAEGGGDHRPALRG